MTDKSWMLNPKAIRQAKECIHLIKDLTGVKLKLSDPEFIQLLHQYVDSTKSRELGESYARLISMAGVGFVVQNLKSNQVASTPKIPLRRVEPDTKAIIEAGVDSGETVECSGKSYPKYRAGLVFKGVYRGQPMYV